MGTCQTVEERRAVAFSSWSYVKDVEIDTSKDENFIFHTMLNIGGNT